MNITNGTNMKNILVIGAHFDDAELGCGGTMAKLAHERKKVYKLTLTDNVTDFRQRNISVGFKESLSDSTKACRILGVEEISDFNFAECNQLEYDTKIMQNVEAVLFAKEIDTVFIHFNADQNQDHIAASNISMTAARHCRNVFYYQSNGYILDSAFYPSVFFDISDFYDKKKKALEQYEGDHNRYQRLFDIALKRTEIWGYANEVAYAVGFVSIKMCL